MLPAPVPACRTLPSARARCAADRQPRTTADRSGHDHLEIAGAGAHVVSSIQLSRPPVSRSTEAHLLLSSLHEGLPVGFVRVSHLLEFGII